MSRTVKRAHPQVQQSNPAPAHPEEERLVGKGKDAEGQGGEGG